MRRCSRESHRTQASGSRVGFPIRKGPRGGDVGGRGPSSVYFLHPSFAPSHPHPCSALVSEKISWSLILTQLKREFVPNPSSGLRCPPLECKSSRDYNAWYLLALLHSGNQGSQESLIRKICHAHNLSNQEGCCSALLIHYLFTHSTHIYFQHQQGESHVLQVVYSPRAERSMCTHWSCSSNATQRCHWQKSLVNMLKFMFIWSGQPHGFRKRRGTRDHTANICWIIEKAREFQKNIYFCFNDYTKVFDFVDHNKLENS